MQIRVVRREELEEIVRRMEHVGLPTPAVSVKVFAQHLPQLGDVIAGADVPGDE